MLVREQYIREQPVVFPAAFVPALTVLYLVGLSGSAFLPAGPADPSFLLQLPAADRTDMLFIAPDKKRLLSRCSPARSLIQ